MSERITWQFSAVDTWFFRESRPHDSAGGSQLSSLFPPPPRTIAGAIRTLVGESYLQQEQGNSEQGNWQAFSNNENHPLRQIIGHAEHMGKIKLTGPWLNYQGQRLYPVPAFLLRKTEGSYTHLTLGEPIECDIGKIRLPQLADDAAGAKPMEDCWLTEAGFSTVMKGDNPKDDDVIGRDLLYQTEPRLGIARNNKTRTAEEGMLYQTVHLRPSHQLQIEVDVTGIEKIYHPAKGQLIRLGGEGRLAEVTLIKTPSPMPPHDAKSQQHILLTLLTHAQVDNPQGLPDGFKKQTPQNPTEANYWRGEIAGIPLTIHGAIVGKPPREGGWDLANQQPRAVESLIPAGSSWYCTLESSDPQAAIKTLHSAQIGNQQALGRGQLAVGIWITSQNTRKEQNQ